MQPQKVHSGAQLFRFVTKSRPAYAGIDPDNYYIDRDSRDNIGSVIS
jgi:hypothetical protein